MPKKSLPPEFDPDDPVQWLTDASRYGVPAVIPCLHNGEHTIITAILQLDKQGRREAKRAPDSVRNALAVIACRRLYNDAPSHGATVHIR